MFSEFFAGFADEIAMFNDEIDIIRQGVQTGIHFPRIMPVPCRAGIPALSKRPAFRVPGVSESTGSTPAAPTVAVQSRERERAVIADSSYRTGTGCHTSGAVRAVSVSLGGGLN